MCVYVFCNTSVRVSEIFRFTEERGNSMLESDFNFFFIMVIIVAFMSVSYYRENVM